jgi:hypothetical protein
MNIDAGIKVSETVVFVQQNGSEKNEKE